MKIVEYKIKKTICLLAIVVFIISFFTVTPKTSAFTVDLISVTSDRNFIDITTDGTRLYMYCCL